MTSKFLTEQITFAGLRQQAERLGIPGFARMRKQELIKAINEAQKLCIKEPNTFDSINASV